MEVSYFAKQRSSKSDSFLSFGSLDFLSRSEQSSARPRELCSLGFAKKEKIE